MNQLRHNLVCPVESASWRRSGGFSLVEILVVTSVITVGFMAVLGLVRKAIIVYYNNQNYLAASTVAQQGLELARYIRDDNWLARYPLTTFSYSLAQNPQDGAKMILAIDREAMVGPDQNRAKIVQFYNSADTTNYGNQLTDLPTGVGNGLLTAYVKDSRAQIYFDTDATQGHNFYTTRATLTTTKKMPPNGDGSVISDTFTATRYKPIIFHNLIQTTYHTNGTPDPADDYLYITSMVYWQDRGADKYFTLSAYLYNYSWKY